MPSLFHNKINGTKNYHGYASVIMIVDDVQNRPMHRLRITLTSWWVRWRPKSPMSRLFTQPFVQAQIKKKKHTHQSSTPLAFLRDIHRGPVNSPHKWPVTRKRSPFDDVVMDYTDVSVTADSKIILQHMYIALQPLDKLCTREVGGSSTRQFLCNRRVGFLTTMARNRNITMTS